MPEHNEASKPVEQVPEARPDTVIVPKSTIASEKSLDGAEGLAGADKYTRQLTEDEYLAKGDIASAYAVSDEARKRAEYEQVRDERTKVGKSSRLAELYIKFFAPENYRKYRESPKSYFESNGCTDEEKFYIQNHWKAYLREYGKHGRYSFEEIVAIEKLAPGHIRGAIEEGLVKDPEAISLYRQAEIDATRKHWQSAIELFSSDPELRSGLERTKQIAADDIARAEREALPLTKGDDMALLTFCREQADENLQIADYAAASSWFDLAVRVILHDLPAQTEQQGDVQEQPPLLQLEKDQQQSTETENPYEAMTSYQIFDLLLEGKLPIEAATIYFQKRKEEELDAATGALYKRIGFSHPDKKIQHKIEAIINAEHAKILAKDYNDPHKIARDVARIEAKYSRLLNTPVEQARYFTNEASKQSSYFSSNHTWMSQEKIAQAKRTAAKLYGLASRLAGSGNGSPQQPGAAAKIKTEKTA